MRLIVETDDINDFNSLKSLLNENGFSFMVDNKNLSKKEDLLLPYRPLTAGEHESHAQSITNDQDEGMEANQFFNELIKEINEWK